MAQDAFIHETDDSNINLPKGENLSVYRKTGILRNPPDAAAPFQVLHPDGYIEPLATAAGGAGVQTVTGQNVDNTDPANPIILPLEVDGVTITGTGVLGDPLVATQSSVVSEFQTVGLVPTVFNFPFNDGDILNYNITGTNGIAGEYIFDRGFSPLSNGVTTIFDNSTGSGGAGGQSIVLNVVGNNLSVTMTGVAAETWNWVFERIFSQF